MAISRTKLGISLESKALPRSSPDFRGLEPSVCEGIQKNEQRNTQTQMPRVYREPKPRKREKGHHWATKQKPENQLKHMKQQNNNRTTEKKKKKKKTPNKNSILESQPCFAYSNATCLVSAQSSDGSQRHIWFL